MDLPNERAQLEKAIVALENLARGRERGTSGRIRELPPVEPPDGWTPPGSSSPDTPLPPAAAVCVVRPLIPRKCPIGLKDNSPGLHENICIKGNVC